VVETSSQFSPLVHSDLDSQPAVPDEGTFQPCYGSADDFLGGISGYFDPTPADLAWGSISEPSFYVAPIDISSQSRSFDSMFEWELYQPLTTNTPTSSPQTKHFNMDFSFTQPLSQHSPQASALLVSPDAMQSEPSASPLKRSRTSSASPPASGRNNKRMRSSKEYSCRWVGCLEIFEDARQLRSVALIAAETPLKY
jgi:hypothetical protein